MVRVAESTEMEFLMMLSRGLTSKEIGVMTGYTDATVETYLVAIRRKYKAKNGPHLVSIAYKAGLLKIS